MQPLGQTAGGEQPGLSVLLHPFLPKRSSDGICHGDAMPLAPGYCARENRPGGGSNPTEILQKHRSSSPAGFSLLPVPRSRSRMVLRGQKPRGKPVSRHHQAAQQHEPKGPRSTQAGLKPRPRHAAKGTTAALLCLAKFSLAREDASRSECGE